MKTLQSCMLVVMAGLLALCSAQKDGPVIIPTTEEPPATTTAAPTTTTSTSSTTTSTTTEPPNTTTPKPTPTTTAAPTTTSTSVPPTTTPVPEPDIGSWTYTNATTNQTCVLAQMALQLNVTYLDTADQLAHVLYDVPKDARVVNGSCAADSQFLVLSWNPVLIVQNTLKVSFAYNKTEHEFALAGLSFFLNAFGDQFPNAKANQSLTLINNQTLFKTPLDMSYHCNRAQLLNLTTVEIPSAKATVTVTKLQFEAFHSKHNAKFSIAKDCDAIDTPDIVPIAVGCALILLIVIVLIAYLVGRRSTRSRGYLSM